MSTRLLSRMLLLLTQSMLFVSLQAQVNVRTEHPVAAAVLPNTALPVDPAKGLMVTTRTGTRPAVDQCSACQSLAPRFV